MLKRTNRSTEINKNIISNSLDKIFPRCDPKLPVFELPHAISKIDISKNRKHNQLAQRIINRLTEVKDANGNVIKNDFNPLLSDYFCYALGDRRRVHKQRRDVFFQCVIPFIKMADSLTGILPKSSITVLSDQCNITTYGKALYDNDGNKLKDLNGEARYHTIGDEIVNKKKSVHRMSRFLTWLSDLGLVETTRLFDRNTGAELPSRIMLTDVFYYMCGETPQSLLNARRQIIGFRKKHQKLSVSFVGKTTEEIIALERERLSKVIDEQRQDYREGKRLASRIKGMTKGEFHDFCRCKVHNHFDEDIRSKWSFDQYIYQIELMKEKVNNQIRFKQQNTLH